MPNPAAPDPGLERHILDGLTDRFGPGWQIRQIYSKPVQDGVVRIYRATNGTRVHAIKANPVPEMNRTQFVALETLRAVTPDSLAPVFLAEQDRYFAMEWCGAPLLAERMHDPDRLALITRAGRWLRRLHDRTAGWRSHPDGALDAEALLPPEPGFDPAEQRRRLVARRLALPHTRGRVAMLHTDFHLHNIFDAGARLIGFDRPENRIGSVHFDLARFLIGTELLRRWAADTGHPWPDDIAADRRAFFTGYGAIPARRLALHDFVEDVVLLRQWRYFARRPRPGPHARDALRRIDGMMRTRGLIGPERPPERPLRVIRQGLRRLEISAPG